MGQECLLGKPWDLREEVTLEMPAVAVGYVEVEENRLRISR